MSSETIRPPRVEHLEDLRPDPHNANRGTPRGHGIIEASVRQRGAGRSGLAAADGTMIAGSQTLQKMAELGIPIRAVHTTGDEWVVVVRDDIEPGSEAAVLLGLEDNQSTLIGVEWEPDILAGIADSGVDLGALFTADEWAKAARPALAEAGNGGDDFDATPEDGPTRTNVGELWIIGGVHRLLVGDCTDAANVARLMGGERADAVVSDPPYDMSYGGRYDPYAMDIGKAKEFEDFDAGFDPAPFLASIASVLTDRHNWFVFTSVFLAWRAYLPYFYEKYDIASLFVWAKPFTFSNVRGVSFAKAYELAVYAWNHGHYFESLSGTENYDVSTVSNNEGGRSYEHPTAKPLALIERVVRQMSPKDGIALDPFLGSGTTLIAAHRTGRRCYGMEISPKYADVILRRADAEGLECERIQQDA